MGEAGLQADIDAYVAANPHVTIERIDNDATKLAAMMAAGTPPDIIRASGADTKVYALRGWVLDLTPYFEKSTVLRPDDMMSPVEYFKFDGGWYGMHKDFSFDSSYIINKRMAEEAGITLPPPHTIITFEQAGEWARKMTVVEGGRVVRMGMESDMSDGTAQRVMMETGEDLYNEDFTKANIKDNPKVVALMTYYAELAKENVIFNPLNPSPNWSVPDLLDGKTASIVIGYWAQASFASAENPVENPENFVMYPALSWGGEVVVNPPMGGAGMFITAGSKNPDEAWKFFEYYMGGEPAISRAKAGWGLPALKSLYQYISLDTEWQQQFYDNVQWEMENSVITPRRINPYYTTATFNGTWSKQLELYLKGEVTLEEAIANTDAEVNKAILDGKAAMDK
jgi:multiple sugar transport system substrate-binding protein